MALVYSTPMFVAVLLMVIQCSLGTMTEEEKACVASGRKFFLRSAQNVCRHFYDEQSAKGESSLIDCGGVADQQALCEALNAALSTSFDCTQEVSKRDFCKEYYGPNAGCDSVPADLDLLEFCE